MKLTDENGGEWETIDGKDFTSFIIRKVEKPANPMPEIKPGMGVIIDDVRLANNRGVFVVQEVLDGGTYWGLNLSRGWEREKFFNQQIKEVYFKNIGLYPDWSREP